MVLKFTLSHLEYNRIVNEQASNTHYLPLALLFRCIYPIGHGKMYSLASTNKSHCTYHELVQCHINLGTEVITWYDL